GLLIEGFQHSPVILMPYNPPYYASLVEGCGFRKSMDLFSYKHGQQTVYTERIVRANDIVKRRQNLTFRSLDMKRFKEEVGRMKDIFNRAWQKNWGAVPMTEAEIDALAADLKPIVVPELVIFAESKGKTIGFVVSLPDINVALKYNRGGGLLMGLFHLMTKKKKIDWARIILVGVLPEHLNTGAAGVMLYETAARAKVLGFKYGEAGWILENNVQAIRAAEATGGELYKKYRLYDLSI
ncbi:MAG TPA: N-acetyltransferase, partial [Bacteroidota bacterium]|nr:N-acetyltransferase [Bacteroidota bacterium]